jgi:hypothetical protein
MSSRTCLALLLAGAGFVHTAHAQTPAQTQSEPAGDVAPDAIAPASPADPVVPAPDWTVRRSVFLKKLVGLQAAYETFPGTFSDHARNFPREWGRTWSGFGKRTASQYGQFVLSESIEFGVSALHHEDPRYHRLGDGSYLRRGGHAMAGAVVTQNEQGRPTPALARIAGVYGAWAIAAYAWNPPGQQNARKVIFYGSVGLLFKSSSNLFREFWPDVKGKFSRKP